MGQMDAPRIAGAILEIEDEAGAVLEPHLAVGETPDAKLRPLQIGHDRDRPADAALDGTNMRDDRRLLVRLAMAHIETEDIDPGAPQLLQHLSRLAHRPHRGDDAGAAPRAHVLRLGVVGH